MSEANGPFPTERRKYIMSIREKVYSKAFENGVNYVIQRLFAEEEEDQNKNKSGAAPWIVGGAIGTAAGLGGGYLASSGNRQNIRNEQINITARKENIDRENKSYENYKGEAEKSYQKSIDRAKESLKEDLEDATSQQRVGLQERHQQRVRELTKDKDKEVKELFDRRNNRIAEEMADIEKAKKSISSNKGAINRKMVGIGAAGLGVGLGAAALYKHFKNKNQQQPQRN